jgi:hypothetical protein
MNTGSKRRALKPSKGARVTDSDVIKETARAAGVREMPKGTTGIPGLLGALVRNVRAELGDRATIEVLMERYREHVGRHLPALGVELSDESAEAMMAVMIEPQGGRADQCPT